MALAVRNEGLEFAGMFAEGGGRVWIPLREVVDLGKGAIDFGADCVDHFHVGQFRPATDVVGLARLPLGQTRFDTEAVILDVQQVTHVHAIAVDRQITPVQRVEQEQRDQLFGILVWPVIVRAIASRHVQPVGMVIGAHQMVGRCLGCRVRQLGWYCVVSLNAGASGPSEPYSRRVVGWAVSDRMKKDLAIRALDMAVRLRNPPEA